MASSLQSKLAKIQAKLKRKLSDNHLNNVGYDHKLLRITKTEDKYKNETIDYTSYDFITGYIEFPNNKVPIFTTANFVSGTSIYDLLPTKAYFKFEDNVQVDDIIIWKYLLNPDTEEYKVLVYTVVEHIGSFSNTLLYQEFNIAPHVLDMEAFPEIKAEIDDWKAEEL